MKQRCLSLVLAISMIMVSASPFSYAKDTLGGGITKYQNDYYR